MRIIKGALALILKSGVNSAGTHNCAALVARGDVDKESGWSFSGDDGNKLLGASGDDWTNYGKWFLGEDATASKNTKDYYKYPFGKDGKVFRSALIAIRSRAAQQNDSAVFAAAGHFIDEIDGTKNYSGKKALPMHQKAWAKFDIEEKGMTETDSHYLFKGIATTPTPDRMEDIVEPMGAEYELPLPLLYQHDNAQPIGQVINAKPNAKGIPVTFQIPKVSEPGNLKDRIDQAMQEIKYMLVRGLSIGFAPIEYSYLEDTGGYRFIKWLWLELSAVTIPANAEATMSMIKSLDQNRLAATGKKTIKVHTKASAVANAKHLEKQVKISEQLKALNEARAAKVAALEAIQEKAAKESRNKDAAEQEEFDTISDEIEAFDRELKDLRRLEKVQVKQSVAVTDPGDDEEEEIDLDAPGGKVATKSQRGVDTHARSMIVTAPKLEKGILFARFVKCLGAARGDAPKAYQIAVNQYKDTPQIGQVLKAMRDSGNDNMESIIQKATVNGGTTIDGAWAGPLVQYNQFAGDFIEYLRPQTILGKFGTGNIPSLRAVPFNIHIRGQTSGGQGYWVGQGQPKPLTSFAFEDVYLGWNKVAAIAVMTEDLLRFSNPSADVLVRDALAQALIARLDTDFVNPAKAAVANTSPASITNGVTAIHSAGHTAADVRADIAAAMTVFIENNISPTTAVWIMPATVALALSLLRNAFGQPEFPNITMNGGTLEGVPVITSQYVPSVTAGALIILANASDIYLSDDGNVTIDASREASLQMLDNPTNASANGTATSVVSMFQTNSVALRAERFINWQKRRANAVVTVDQVAYTGG